MACQVTLTLFRLRLLYLSKPNQFNQLKGFFSDHQLINNMKIAQITIIWRKCNKILRPRLKSYLHFGFTKELILTRTCHFWSTATYWHSEYCPCSTVLQNESLIFAASNKLSIAHHSRPNLDKLCTLLSDQFMRNACKAHATPCLCLHACVRGLSLQKLHHKIRSRCVIYSHAMKCHCISPKTWQASGHVQTHMTFVLYFS